MCNSQIYWVLASIFAYVIALAFNGLSTSGAFGPDQGELSDKYGLPITPPGWTFSIWGIIYLWQSLWLVYMLYRSIRYSTEIKANDTITFGKLFYISWILSCVFNGLWISLFAMEQLTISSLVLISISLSLYVNGWVGHKYVGVTAEDTDSCTVSLYRVFVLNGVAFYGTWCSIAQCLNIAIMITYDFDVNVDTASMIALAILTIVILAYWFLDFYYLRKWLAYTYSPYAVLLWALSAITTNPREGEMALTGVRRTWVNVLLIMVAVGTVCKFVSGILFVCRQQSINDKDVKTYTSADVDVNDNVEV